MELRNEFMARLNRVGITPEASKKLGVTETTIQAILRHESVSTSYYIKTAREDATDAMKQLEEKLCAAVVQQMAN